MAITDATLSIRLLWPFMRLRTDAESLQSLEQAGIDLRALADPDTRVPHTVAMDLLERAVSRTGDGNLGLRAAETLEPGDLGVLEYAARSCGTLRGALDCLRRYIALVNDSVSASLEELGATATWRLAVIDGVRQHPCANDFQLACAVMMSRRLTGLEPELTEVHFAHPEAASSADYGRIFHCKLRFGMRVNALVFPRADLDRPLRLANPGLQAAYALHAEEELRRLERNKDIASRVRAVLAAQMRTGHVGIQTVARTLATSPATLRRHLEREGTSVTALLDDLRRDLATKYLGDTGLAISEIAFLLGFSHVPAFYRAFQRWYPKQTPADFRESLKDSATASEAGEVRRQEG